MIDNQNHELLIKRALESPWIADFELNLDEIEQHLIDIYKIFKAKDACNNANNQLICGNNGYHFKLIKDKNGSIILVTYPCPKNLLNKSFLINNNYIYSSINLDTQHQLLDKQNILLDNNKTDSYRIKLINFFLKIKKELIHPNGFYIYGQNATGKSYLSVAFCNEMAIKNKKIVYLLMTNFCLDIMQNLDQQKDVTNIIEYLKTTDILVIDELGTEKYNAYIHNQILYSILNHRLYANKMTIFCSKYSLNELLKVYKMSSKDKNIINFIERISNLCKLNIFNLIIKIKI